MINQASLPFSQASENNRLPILEILRRHLAGRKTLLEIGGGTGQHAAFFAAQFPGLIWQSSDIPASVDMLNLRIAHAGLANLPLAFGLDVNENDWHCGRYQAAFTANSLHIMSEGSVENLFAGIIDHIEEGGLLLVYGPFKYHGEFTTGSNARFDVWLKQRDSVSGIREFEWVNDLAENAGFRLLEDNAMPANNQLIVWQML